MKVAEEDLVKKSKGSKEIDYSTCNGFCMLLLNFALLILSIICLVITPITKFWFLYILAIPLFFISCKFWGGFFTLQRNEAMVLVLVGTYKGTVKTEGYHWVNPYFSFTKISLRSNNLNGETLKVNDKSGNSIQIAAVVVWKVKNTAKAIFDVENYENFVKVQYEAALRHLASCYSYDTDGKELSLRGGHEEITQHLKREMQEKLSNAGIKVKDARITTLSYANEIAGVMLKRQQAEAIIQAREKIVQGAVSIIGNGINSLHANKIVDMNNEERVRLVSNMLVVLCSDTQVSPTLSTNA